MISFDLKKRPPRSPRIKLGGYVILPRMLDKGRATIAQQNGDYHYACPLDERFLTYVGIDPDQLLVELASGKGDSDILDWIEVHAKNNRDPWEVEQWSAYQEQRTPSDTESRKYFTSQHRQATERRKDIVTWFDLLDLDDYITFGGLA